MSHAEDFNRRSFLQTTALALAAAQTAARNVLRNPLKHQKTHFSDPLFHNNIRKTESFTDRLLYQLSYVGLSSILNGGGESVKRASLKSSF